jgi:hypothetical protein
MKQFDRTNTGTLGRNKNRKNDKQPEYKGSINIGGVEYWLSGWVKTAGDNAPEPGSKFFSLSVTPKDGFPDRKPPPKGELTEANWATAEMHDDKIPF